MLGRRMRAAVAGSLLLFVLLIGQVIAAAVAVERDSVGEFSAAPAVAHYLDSHGFIDNRTLIAVVQSFTAHSILANLKEPGTTFYFPQLERFGTFTSWSAQWRATREGYTLEQTLASIDHVAGPYDRVLLIENQHGLLPNASAPAAARLTHIAAFGEDLVGARVDVFDLYWVDPPAP
jgi:hypothetical protein